MDFKDLMWKKDREFLIDFLVLITCWSDNIFNILLNLISPVSLELSLIWLLQFSIIYVTHIFVEKH